MNSVASTNVALPAELALDARDEFVRHGAAADPADGAVAATLELGGDDLGLIFVGVGDAKRRPA